jgi:aryl-alcohol dehydrogenase-like predicted oxidoreductase
MTPHGALTTPRRRSHVIHPVSVLQTEYSVFERAVEADVLPVVRELGIGSPRSAS